MNLELIANANKSLQYLKSCAAELDVIALAETILLNDKFFIWSGSSKPFQHHYGMHGLVIHTAEVVQLCLNNNDLLKSNINKKELFCAALFHDVGKMWDYKPINAELTEWDGTEHKRQIHHVSRSALVWHEEVTKLSAYRDKYDWLNHEAIDNILHAILAHHGQRAWGSPVMPNTKLAWMLHLCDGISARMNDAEKWDQTKR